MRGPTHAIRLAAAAVAAVSLTSLTGCVFWAPSLDPIRHEMEATVPQAHVDSQIQLRLGRISLALARSIVRAAADDDGEAREVAEILSHVKGVEVAVYEVSNLEPHQRARWLDQLGELSRRRGWQTAARIRDEGSVGSVLYQFRGETIRNVYVFALDEESLVLARFRGRLDEAIADAIALRGREVPDALVDAEGDEGP